MSVRLFVAVDIDSATRAAVADVIERVAHRLRNADVKWVPAPNLHITLQFIGHVDDAVALRIREALAPAVPVAPFEIRIEGLGAFPPRGGPRVLWCGVVDRGARLAAVYREVSRRLGDAAGIVPEARPYTPHLTIGRYRESGRAADRRTIDTLTVGELGRPFVDQVTLYESRLSPRGPTYLAAAFTPLSATIDPSQP